MANATYHTTTVEELYPEVTDYRPLRLYVYSTTNNPDGAGKGTNARLLGYAENYSTAMDLWEAAVAASRAIYGSRGDAEIGLCVEKPQADDSVARYAAIFAADAGEQALYLNRTTDEVADLCVAVADEAVKRRDAAFAKGEDYYAMAFVETAASWLSNHPRATFLELCLAGQREVDMLKGDTK